MDWKEALKGLQADDAPRHEVETIEDGVSDEASAAKQTAKLNVVIDRKGRKGKSATIVEGFTISDDEVEKIAATLKKKLGCGGSARGGEILIQGERLQEVKDLLRGLGYPVK